MNQWSWRKAAKVVAVCLLIAAACSMLFFYSADGSNRLEVQARLSEIVVAMEAYADTHGFYPAQGRRIPGAKTGLSWRVEILPQLGYQHLWSAFRLDEPWDSKHNLTLIPQMPKEYKSPYVHKLGHTSFVAPIGERTIISRERGAPLDKRLQWQGRILLLIDIEESIPWTAPVDFEVATSEMSPRGESRSRSLAWTMLTHVGCNVAYAGGGASFIPSDGARDIILRKSKR